MKKPSVSIAMATYNGERFLQEQLVSLSRQTMLPCELVVCDDGSTDSTLTILHRFATEAPFPVRIYRNPERLGFRDNFLRAVELCEGNLVAFSDQDDVWLPRKLAVCAEKFDSGRVSMVVHLVMLTDRNLVPLGHISPSLVRFRKVCPEVPSLRYMDVIGMAMVFRREVARPLQQDAVLRKAISQTFLGHDIAMRFLAGAYGSVVPVREVLALRRFHDGNTSRADLVGSSTASAFVRSACGVGNRLAAAAKWTKMHTNVALGISWHDYACEAESLESKAKVLRGAATRADDLLRVALERTSAAMSRRADAVTERSLLYRESSGKGLARLCLMLLRGRYRSRNRGGLGLWSLAKDFLITFQFSRQRAQCAEDQA